MSKRLLCAFVFLFVFSFSLAGGAASEEKTWTGWITDTSCGARGNNAGHAACAKRCVGRGEKYALYTSEGELYVVEPQEEVTGYAAQEVKVRGTLEGETIKIISIEKAGD